VLQTALTVYLISSLAAMILAAFDVDARSNVMLRMLGTILILPLLIGIAIIFGPVGIVFYYKERREIKKIIKGQGKCNWCGEKSNEHLVPMPHLFTELECPQFWCEKCNDRFGGK